MVTKADPLVQTLYLLDFAWRFESENPRTWGLGGQSLCCCAMSTDSSYFASLMALAILYTIVNSLKWSKS